jgi:hypothetical protein
LEEEIVKTDPETGNVWSSAKPEELPEFTFWPIILATGVVFFFWGFITSLIVSGAGLAIMGTAMFGWIGEFGDE